MLVVAVELHLFMVVLMELAVLAEAVPVFHLQMEQMELLIPVVEEEDLLTLHQDMWEVLAVPVSSSLLTQHHKYLKNHNG
jgi:hypothetical protein